MDEIEDPFPRPFRSFVASRVDQRCRNESPRLVYAVSLHTFT